MCLCKTAYLRLTQTVLLHDVETGVICFLLCLALFLVILGNSILDILFPEGSRTPGMDGNQLIAVAYLIQATVLLSTFNVLLLNQLVKEFLICLLWIKCSRSAIRKQACIALS